MATWEYLELTATSQHGIYVMADNILVSTSDGVLQRTKIGKTLLAATVNQLGARAGN